MLTTSKLLHCSTTVTMFLPMSCTSPLTVAITILPLALASRPPPSPASSASMYGIRCATACFITRADFDHLRQEHLALAEQVADHVHAVHQRAFDHVQRAAALARISR